MFSLHRPVFCFARGPGPGQCCKHRVGGMSQPLPPPPGSDCLNCLKRAIVILIIDIPRGLARVVSPPAPAPSPHQPHSTQSHAINLSYLEWAFLVCSSRVKSANPARGEINYFPIQIIVLCASARNTNILTRVDIDTTFITASTYTVFGEGA